MSNHISVGKQGEQKAVEFLENNQYTILHLNYRIGKDEADIICTKDNYLIFVEVKTRSTDYFQKPYEAVTKAKQQNLIRLANNYVERENTHLEIRFDVVSVIKRNNHYDIQHIKDAFQP
ncbi:MAG: YraN family protein [Bacteroidetes bacterium]|nr:MAG: YraN family protein [Bacteroidota bacterium]